MIHHTPRPLRTLFRALLTPAAGFIGLALGACTTIDSPALKNSALALPESKRSHVYAIFLNSMNDPLGVTNFKSLYNFAIECGFTSSRYHHFDGGTELAAEIRAILKADRDAKICLIGWSGASLYAFDATGLVARDGIIIDEIIYLDSNWIKEKRLDQAPHPGNVGRVALLYSENRTPPTNVPNPAYYKIPVKDHSDSASAPQSGEIIVHELILLTNRTPANH